MREPPAAISIDALRGSLHTSYGLDVAELEFLPRGADSSAWVYRVRTTTDSTYFLKVRARMLNTASLLLPHYLQARGITQVVAPLPNPTGALWTHAGEYALVLYPFVAGPTGMEHGMSEQQWSDFGALLRQIHDTPPGPELRRVLRRDAFIPDWAAMARTLDAHIGQRTFEDPPEIALALFWQARRHEIRSLLETAEALGPHLAAAAPEFVLCHADMHTNNVLLDANDQVWIADWDETMLAPRERDLMFVVGGIGRGLVSPSDEARFFEGYGQTSVDPASLAYYRYCWALSDIASYAEQVLFRPDLGPNPRRMAVDRCMSAFAPGNIVELAFGSHW